MKVALFSVLVMLCCAFAHGQARTHQDIPVALLKSLRATRVSCPEEVRDDESRLLCASTRRGATSFKEAVEAVDDNTLIMRATGDWASYEGMDVQRSYLYRDGFLTIALYQRMWPNDTGLVIVRTLMPHD